MPQVGALSSALNVANTRYHSLTAQKSIQEKLSHFCIKLYASTSPKSAANGHGDGQSPHKERQNGGGVEENEETLEDLRTVYALNVGKTHIGRAQACEICILDKVRL